VYVIVQLLNLTKIVVTNVKPMKIPYTLNGLTEVSTVTIKINRSIVVYAKMQYQEW